MSLLSAYSTPSQPGTSGTPLVFDKNALSYGTSISHTEGSSTFSISKPGVYNVTFNGGLAPASGAKFPFNVTLFLQKNGSAVSGASTAHNFQASSETTNLGFNVPISVSSVPATLAINANSGQNFIYTGISMTINRLGDIPTV